MLVVEKPAQCWDHIRAALQDWVRKKKKKDNAMGKITVEATCCCV